jgi:dihydroorotate dehydrogenase (NAD+) catalytic subunit
MDLTTRVGRWTLKNPITVASGTYGYARECAPFDDFSKLGAIVPKSVTEQPRKGNAPPRVVETASGMLNAIGLDNDGIEHFIGYHLPYLRTLGTQVVVNVAGKSVAEFARLAERLGGQSGVDAIELNLSCPNVAGGIDFAIDPDLAEKVVRAVRESCALPLLAKLTPNVTNLVPIAQAVAAGGADAVTLINTVLGTAIDWRRRQPMLANVFGGLSGPAIKPIALRCVLQVRQAVAIGIVGVGGIATIDDVMEFLVGGASAVQVGTANFYDPGVATRLVDELPAAIAALGEESVAHIVGSVKWNATGSISQGCLSLGDPLK